MIQNGGRIAALQLDIHPHRMPLACPHARMVHIELVAALWVGGHNVLQNCAGKLDLSAHAAHERADLGPSVGIELNAELLRLVP